MANNNINIDAATLAQFPTYTNVGNVNIIGGGGIAAGGNLAVAGGIGVSNNVYIGGHLILKPENSNEIDVCNVIQSMAEKIRELEAKVESMDVFKKRIDHIETHLEYMPDGSGYNAAEKDFNERMKELSVLPKEDNDMIQ